MDSCLTQPIPVVLPKWQPYSAAPPIPGYSDITSLTPIIKELYGPSQAPSVEGQLQSDHLFGKVVEFDGSGPCKVLLAVKKKVREAYCKVTHLLDPVRKVQGSYEHPVKGAKRRQAKLENPMNQAFVDALGNYLLGQLREKDISPHFCLFFGGFQGVADAYRYDITEEFASYRNYKDFWNRRRAGLFKLHMEIDTGESDSEDEDATSLDSETKAEFEDLLKTPTSSLRSTPFSYTTPRSAVSVASTRKSHISLDGDLGAGEKGVDVELQSVGSFSDLEGEAGAGSATVNRRRSEEGDSEESEEDSEDSSEGPQASIAVEFEKFPVMLIFQEMMDGVFDDLMFDEEEVGAEQDTPEWEERWTAWIFQVIAALCCAQGVLGFTHNDLHSNNIVWEETDQPWLWYKARDGSVFRVPTFGKIFRLIDFGRAVFRVGEKWFASDDYARGGDAERQYNFEPFLWNPKAPVVVPNPSFDLCRLSVSILDSLFPSPPAEVLEGGVLSKEGMWEVRETESPLWNLLWSWLLDSEGKNILRDEDGTERFPDFDLYIHISAACHGAKPQDQIHKPIFAGYKVAAKDVGEWEKVYPLFC